MNVVRNLILLDGEGHFYSILELVKKSNSIVSYKRTTTLLIYPK